MTGPRVLYCIVLYCPRLPQLKDLAGHAGRTGIKGHAAKRARFREWGMWDANASRGGGGASR